MNVSTEPLVTRMTVEEADVADALKAARVARSLIQPPVVSKYTESEFAEETTVYCTQVSLLHPYLTSHYTGWPRKLYS